MLFKLLIKTNACAFANILRWGQEITAKEFTRDEQGFDDLVRYQIEIRALKWTQNDRKGYLRWNNNADDTLDQRKISGTDRAKLVFVHVIFNGPLILNKWLRSNKK